MTRGRPQRFDMDTALTAAEGVFRAKGFFGAGVTELMAAIGVGGGSFYAAFSSKAELYQWVLERAATHRLDAARLALGQPELGAALVRLVQVEADSLFGHEVPGCIFALSGAQQWTDAARRWRLLRGHMQRLIAKRCETAIGDEADELSKRVVSILDALAMQAASGASKIEALGLADLALGSIMARHRSEGHTIAA